jgi:hypothetical protein
LNRHPGTSCSWCGAAVDATDGYRAAEHAGDRGAVFCRLEHVVPWALQGGHWDAGEPPEPAGTDRAKDCSFCGAPLVEAHVLLVRHRGEYRIADGFCSVDHLGAWARQGGRYSASS